MVCVLLIDSLVVAISERHCENRGIDGFYGSLDFVTLLWSVSPSVEQLLDFGWAC